MRNIPGLDSMKALVFYISVVASQGAVFSTLTSCDNEYGGQIDLCAGELKKTLEKESREVLEDFDKYKDSECSEEILKKAVERAVEEDPGAALAYFDKYKNKPYANDLLKKAAEKTAESDPGSALAYFDKYQDKPYTEKILKKAAEKAAEDDPEAALHYFDKYQDKPYANDLLKKAAEKTAENDPEAALAYFDKYKNKPYVEEILKKVAENGPGVALARFDRYKNKPYASNIINTISLTELLFFLTQAGSLPEDKLFKPVLSLFEGLHSIKKVKLFNKILQLDPSEHVNIYSGLLKTYLSDTNQYSRADKTIDRERVKKSYEDNIAKFIEQGKKWSEKTQKNINVFIVRAAKSAGDDSNSALTDNNENLKKVYKEKFAGVGRFHDYSSDINPQSPEFILNAFENSVREHPNERFLFHFGAHGEKNGSGLLKGGDRKKEHFDRLFNIKAKYPNHIKVDLMSCNSGTKDSYFYDNTVKNLSMNSQYHPGYGGKEGGSDYTFLEAFEAKDKKGNLEADYDGDGIVNFNEALLYRNINYNKSLTPTMFNDGSGGRAKDISMNDGIYRDASLYSS